MHCTPPVPGLQVSCRQPAGGWSDAASAVADIRGREYYGWLSLADIRCFSRRHVCSRWHRAGGAQAAAALLTAARPACHLWTTCRRMIRCGVRCGWHSGSWVRQMVVPGW